MKPMFTFYTSGQKIVLLKFSFTQTAFEIYFLFAFLLNMKFADRYKLAFTKVTFKADYFPTIPILTACLVQKYFAFT